MSEWLSDCCPVVCLSVCLVSSVPLGYIVSPRFTSPDPLFTPTLVFFNTIIISLSLHSCLSICLPACLPVCPREPDRSALLCLLCLLACLLCTRGDPLARIPTYQRTGTESRVVVTERNEQVHSRPSSVRYLRLPIYLSVYLSTCLSIWFCVCVRGRDREREEEGTEQRTIRKERQTGEKGNKKKEGAGIKKNKYKKQKKTKTAPSPSSTGGSLNILTRLLEGEDR